jgi:hypothetical protein
MIPKYCLRNIDIIVGKLHNDPYHLLFLEHISYHPIGGQEDGLSNLHKGIRFIIFHEGIIGKEIDEQSRSSCTL